MAITNDDISRLKGELLNNATDVTKVDFVNSLDNMSSLPALDDSGNIKRLRLSALTDTAFVKLWQSIGGTFGVDGYELGGRKRTLEQALERYEQQELVARWEAAREEMSRRFHGLFDASSMGYNEQTDRFFLNGVVDLTAQEARVILDSPLRYPKPDSLERSSMRTNLLYAGESSAHNRHLDLDRTFYRFQGETLLVGDRGAVDVAWPLSPGSAQYFITDCPNLRKVYGIILCNHLTNDNCTYFLSNCPKLEDVEVFCLNGSLDLDLSRTPKLTLQTLRAMLAMIKLPYYHDELAGTIKVSAEVFAKIYNEEELPVPGTDSTDWEGYTPNLVRNSGVARTLTSADVAYSIWGLGYGLAQWTTYGAKVWTDATEGSVRVASAKGTQIGALTAANGFGGIVNTNGENTEAGVKLAVASGSGNVAIERVSITPGDVVPTRWSACSDDVEDAELREKIQWRELHYLAAQRHYSFTK